MARTTRSPTDAEIITALRETYALSEAHIGEKGSCVQITREGTRMTIHWFGGLVQDLCEIDGELAMLDRSHYNTCRRRFAKTLGVVIEDRYNGWDLFLREDY